VTTSADTLEYDENNAIPWGELGANVAGTPLTAAAAISRSTMVGTRIKPYQLFRVLQAPGAVPMAAVVSGQRDLRTTRWEEPRPPGTTTIAVHRHRRPDAFRFCAVAGD
jgi:hypothetical protein